MKGVMLITADFDEKELHTKVYENIDYLVEDRTGWPSYADMKLYVDEHGYDAEECEGSEKFLIELVQDGYYVDEWHSYELHSGDFTMGVGNV